MYCRAHKTATLTPIQHTVHGGNGREVGFPCPGCRFNNLHLNKHLKIGFLDCRIIDTYVSDISKCLRKKPLIQTRPVKIIA